MAAIESMTGYGRVIGKTDLGNVSTEIRCVNNKGLDISFRGPRELGACEPAIRTMMAEVLLRGRVEITLTLRRRAADSVNLEINLGLAEKYHGLAKKLADHLGTDAEVPLEYILRFPDVIYEEEGASAEGKSQEQILALVRKALDQVVKMRGREGRALAKDIRERIVTLEKSVKVIAKERKNTLEETRQRLRDRIQELLGGRKLDEGRLEQEVTFLVDRSDIQEEITRLESHFHQFREILKGEGSIGRELDFLCQELIRETNTIASKTSGIAITREVLAMKGEIGKIREQVQNIR